MSNEWIKNTGTQPVADDVEVDVRKLAKNVELKNSASYWAWDKKAGNFITHWRLARTYEPNEGEEMTKGQRRIDIMQWFENGDKIECSYRDRKHWDEDLTPTWDWSNYDYRKAVTQWEPKDGHFFIENDGLIGHGITGVTDYSRFGSVRNTREAALEASKLMRSHNRLLAYVHEHGGVQPFVTGKQNWYVNGWNNAIVCRDMHDKRLGQIFMTEDCARSLAKELNNGEVVL